MKTSFGPPERVRVGLCSEAMLITFVSPFPVITWVPLIAPNVCVGVSPAANDESATASESAVVPTVDGTIVTTTGFWRCVKLSPLTGGLTCTPPGIAPLFPPDEEEVVPAPSRTIPPTGPLFIVIDAPVPTEIIEYVVRLPRGICSAFAGTSRLVTTRRAPRVHLNGSRLQDRGVTEPLADSRREVTYLFMR